MGLEMYQHQVLPRIIEQVVSCKDDIAQQYLMDCMIQASQRILSFAVVHETQSS